MTEEEKKENIEKDEDKGVEVKKTLDVDLGVELSEGESEIEDLEWYNWGTRIGPDMWGIFTSRSK